METKLTNDAMLAPKRLHLRLKETTVPEAVAELARQSGYDVQLAGDRSTLALRTITLDTGDTTFWEALDRLCRQAGLVERTAQAPPTNPFMVPAVPGMRQPALPPGALPVMPPAKPAAPRVLQLQAKPGRAAPPGQFQPVQPAMPGQLVVPGGLNRLPTSTGPILLAEGKPADYPTYYAGAVRIRVRPASPGMRAKEAGVVLDVAAEPRLQDFRIVGLPRIDTLIDEHEQALAMVIEAAPDRNLEVMKRGNVVLWEGNPFVPKPDLVVRVKLGDKRAKTLKHFSGGLSAQALSQTEPLLAVDNILKAAGTTAKGKSGGSLQVHSVDKLPGGDIQVKLTMENLPGQNPAGMIGGMIQVQGQGVIQIRQLQVNGNRVIINGLQGASHTNYPKLLDAKGQPFTLVQAPTENLRLANGQATISSTLVFRGRPGQGEPEQLVLYGQRPIDFQVPFAFKNVPLQ